MCSKEIQPEAWKDPAYTIERQIEVRGQGKSLEAPLKQHFKDQGVDIEKLEAA